MQWSGNVVIVRYMPTDSAPVTTDGLPRVTVSVAEAALMLGISRDHAYKMVRAGRIPNFKLGDRYLIPLEQLRALVTGGGQ